jgi:glycerophosphoryl diester phosphodiesterase
VPTLDELLDGFGTRIALNLELKQGSRGAYAGLPAVAVAEVRARGLEERTLYSSFYDPVLPDLRRVDPEARIALLISRRAPQGWVERARALGAEAVNPELPLVDRDFVERAHGELRPSTSSRWTRWKMTQRLLGSADGSSQRSGPHATPRR